MTDWLTIPTSSNKLNQTYFQNFIDVSGVMSIRNSHNINLYTEGAIPEFSINSQQIRVKDQDNYYDISNSKLRHIQNLYENVQDRLEDLVSRTQYTITSPGDEKTIFYSSIEISNNLICLSDLSLNGNLFIDKESVFNGRVDICGNFYAKYPNNSVPISAITNLEYNLNTKSNLISPEFTGVPTAPTAASGTIDTQLATTAFVAAAVSSVEIDITQDITVNTLTVGKGAGNVVSNSAFGYQALYTNTTGNDNVAIGFNAGHNNTTGSYNSFVGYNTNISPTTATWQNSSALGNGALITASNLIVLGNSSIDSLRCQVQSITSLSDARDKKNIQPLTNGIAFVAKLNPVKFDWNMRDGGKVDIPEMGFIAQDLQQVQKETGITVPGLVSDSNPDRLEASYGTLIPILVKAIQDLSEKVTRLESNVTELEIQNASIPK